MARLTILFALLARRAAAKPLALMLDGDAKKPMPMIGFGTCCRASAKGPALVASAKAYLAAGGRLIDTAAVYGNHADVAAALRASGVPRDEVWVTTKLSYKAVATRAAATAAVDAYADELGVEYLDLVLIHHADDATNIDVWRGLLDAKEKGKARHVGVSNFNRAQIEALAEATGEWPAANQIEFHPRVDAHHVALVAWCREKGIAVTAYNSLGGKKAGDVDAAVAEVASSKGATPAAVLLRWALNQRVAVIPGATSEAHIRENLDLPEITFTADDLAKLRGGAPRLRYDNLLAAEASAAAAPARAAAAKADAAPVKDAAAKTDAAAKPDPAAKRDPAAKPAAAATAAKKASAVAAFAVGAGHFYVDHFAPARAATNAHRRVRLLPLCAAAAAARATLSVAETLEAAAAVSVRGHGADFFEDHAFTWWLPHWLGVCEVRRHGAIPDASINGARAAWDAYAARFVESGNQLNTAKASYAPRQDDACVWLHRELAPSFVHGMVWTQMLRRREACGAGSAATQRACLEKAVAEVCADRDWGALKGECGHGTMHGAFLWAAEDIAPPDGDIVPIDGAYAAGAGSLDRETFRSAVVAFEPKLAAHTHSFRIYIDFVPGEEASHWLAFLHSNKEYPLRFAPRFPPVTEPCRADVLGEPETNFLRAD